MYIKFRHNFFFIYVGSALPTLSCEESRMVRVGMIKDFFYHLLNCIREVHGLAIIIILGLTSAASYTLMHGLLQGQH